MQLNRSALPLIALSAALCTTAALSQQNQPKSAMSSRGARSATLGGPTTGHCRRVMAMRDQMMSEMKGMDASVDQKLAAMNAAKGNAKVEAAAAVINEVVSQRKQIMASMKSMQDQMIAHMSGHLARSGSSAMRQSMAQCPLMKGMAP
jgi:hypothetical protein